VTSDDAGSGQTGDGSGLEPPAEPDSVRVPAFLRDLERTLGVGVIVRSVEDGPTVTIRAILLMGQHSEPIVGEGRTEAEAWQAVARSAIAWRTTNDKHIPWWGGGG